MPRLMKRGHDPIHCDESQVIAFINQGWERAPDEPEMQGGAVVPGESPGSIQFRQERLTDKGCVLMVKGESQSLVEREQVAAMEATGWKIATDDDEAEPGPAAPTTAPDAPQQPADAPPESTGAGSKTEGEAEPAGGDAGGGGDES